MPGPIPLLLLLLVAWKNSIHRQPGNRACPSALLSSPSSSLSSFPRTRLPVLKILQRESLVYSRGEADIRRGRCSKSNPRGERVKPRWRRNGERSRGGGNFTRSGSRFGFSWDRVGLHAGSTPWNRIRYVSVFVELAQWSLISTMNRVDRSCSYISMINR